MAESIPEAACKSTPTLPRVKVLMVDDHAEDLMALEAVLGGLDVDLVKASSGEEALRRLLEEDFSVILLDVHMPGMNGFETASLIRQRERSRRTPIIFLTGADTNPANQFKAYAVGAVDYIMKPLSPEVLRSKVSVFVELAKALQQVSAQAEQLKWLAEREKKQMLDEVTARRNRIFSLSPDLIGITGFDGIIRQTNPAWETFGWSPTQLVGTKGIDLVHPDDRPAIAALRGQIPLDGSVTPIEIRIRCADGSHRWVAWRIMAWEKQRLFYLIGRDVEEKRRWMDEIGRLNSELERRVAERTAQLESANRELESFSYSVSHDLRAPLRAIEGFTRRLTESYGPLLDTGANRLIDVVLSNTKRMGQLIDDLLEFSRMGRAELRKDRVEMKELAQQVSGDLVATNPGRKIEFHIGDLLPAWGDRALLRQVWINLLGNAVKYTRPRSVAVIEIRSRQEGAMTSWSIADNGVGFDATYTHKLFGVFQRLHSADEFEGTGVGLALVQKVIQRHGGLVRAEGKVGEGATFTFSLPAKPRDNA